MVSPPYKEGYGATEISAVAPNGERVAFYSPGTFASSASGVTKIDYLASRRSNGWATVPIAPPTTLVPDINEQDVSSSLSEAFALGKPGESEETAFQQGTTFESLRHAVDEADIASNWSAVTLSSLNNEPLAVNYAGASSDLCHVIVGQSNQPLLEEAKESNNPGSVLYDVSRGCHGTPASERVVNLTNGSPSRLLSPPCETQLGIGKYAIEGRRNEYNAIADGGEEIFFTLGLEKNAGCVGGGSGAQHQLFVRVGGVKTIEVSRPPSECSSEGVEGEVPCEDALSRASSDFVGASEDGTRAFFTTTQPLLASDHSNNLYMATIGCPKVEPQCEAGQREVVELTEVSHGPASEPAEVQGVVRVSQDGSHVYFVARGDLLASQTQALLAAEGRPVPRIGADNLYVYDADASRLAFVAMLCSGPETSGMSTDRQCPSNLESRENGRNDARLWGVGGNDREAQTSQNGRYMVFTSLGRLTPGDDDTARDVFRYDAGSGTIDRVSLGEAGADENGNDDRYDASIHTGTLGGYVRNQYEMATRAISNDGTRIVFDTQAPLSPAATNGLVNVYEWHQESTNDEGGSVSLVSSGDAEESVDQYTITPEGNDIMFITVQGLLPQDTDGAPDIYDARVGGGFPQEATEREPCEVECQGPLTSPPSMLVPGSAVQAPGGNVEPSATPTIKTTKRPTKKDKKTGKRRNRRGRGRAGRRVRRVRSTRSVSRRGSK